MKNISIPEKRLIILHLLIGMSICLLIMFPFFDKGIIYLNDDFAFHRVRLESYFEAVKHLDFSPKIFENMANGYGYAADLFYPSIFLFPYTILRLLNFGYIDSYYGYMLIICFATFLSAYFSSKPIFSKPSYSLLFSLLYLTATYRLLDQFIRGALGETLAFIFLPMIFLGLYRLIYRKEHPYFLLAVAMSLLVYAHIITALIATISIGVFIFYRIVTKKITKEIILSLTKSTFIAFLLSAFVLIPILEQSLNITFVFFQDKSLWPSGINFNLQLLLSNSIANNSNVWGSMGPGVGSILILFLVIALFRFDKVSHRTKSLLTVSIIFLLVSTNLFPWITLRYSFLSVIQFPWRILAFATFFLCLSFTSFVQEQKFGKKIALVAVIPIVLLTVSFTNNLLYNFERNDSLKVTESSYELLYPAAIGGGNEYLPISFNQERLKEVYAGRPSHNNNVKVDLDDKGYKRKSYTITAHHRSQIVSLPTIYYLGYSVLVDGNEVPNYEEDGLLTFEVAEGTHSVEVLYVGTSLQKQTLALSTIVWIFLIVFPIYHHLKKKSLSKKL